MVPGDHHMGFLMPLDVRRELTEELRAGGREKMR
jgi:hypothetical protein